MFSFLCALTLLLLGYLFYGKFVERSFGPDPSRETPALTVNDGVDFVPMSGWKVYLIQVLNIAGTGPIFGALNGALFGPVVYLWIVFGCIFFGATHDYMCGMLSVRHRGASISELTGLYLGNAMLRVMRVFSVILLVMCGVVFTAGPAGLLALLTPEKLDAGFWFWVVIAYYFVATFVPIDKVIGRVYPLFGVCLIVMAVGVGASLLLGTGGVQMPELWNNFENHHAQNIPIWPFMFITVACGAISGFHATQSPLMARCIKSEASGRKIFYGAMITEGVIALVWAAAGVSCYEDSQALLAAGGGISSVVYAICQTTMGKVGGILALIGVIVCPISSGDTAYRSARLTLADWFKIDQADWKKRLLVTVPLLGAGLLISRLDYSVVWRYFSWSNQTLAMIALWAISMYLFKSGKNWRLTSIPAFVMSAVTTTYFVSAPECLGHIWGAFGIQQSTYYPIACAVGAAAAILFWIIFRRGALKAEKISSGETPPHP